MILRILSVALAAWLGGGAIAYGLGHARFGLTPAIGWFVLALAGATLARRRRVALLALALVLPWLPVRVPAAFLLWTGPAALWIVALIAGTLVIRPLARRLPIDPARAPTAAVAIAAVLFVVAAWRVSPQLPAGDEPHYLVIAQSLLTDRDLQIENNHRRGDYRAYFPGELRPDYLRRGKNDQIYSIHAPGLPAIVAPAFALFGYRGVVVFLALVAAMATGVAWSAAYRITGDAGAAWFGWAVVALTEPFLVQSFMVYPDAPAAAIVMFAVAALLLGRAATLRQLAFAGAALALLPWLHTRAAILAACLGAALAFRQLGDGAVRRIGALAAAPLVSAVAWFAFFYAIYGTIDPRAPYGGARQMALDAVPRGALGLLFDQQFGLLSNAPVYLFAALGFGPLARRHPRVAIELAATLVPYAIAVAAFQMWWAGYTTPARFLVPMLLPLAIPAAVWFDAVRGRAVRVAALGTLGISGLITIAVVGVDRGALLLNFRDGASRLLVWLSPVVELTSALPSLFHGGPAAMFGQSLVWLAAGAAVLTLARLASVERLDGDRQQLAIGAAAIVAVMIAATVAWQGGAAPPLEADGGAAAWLQAYDGDAAQVALALSPFGRVRRAAVPEKLALVDAAPTDGAPLGDLRHVPAATYAIELSLKHRAAGKLTVSLDRTLGPTWTVDLAGAGLGWRTDVVVPVAAPALIVDADPAVRAAVARVRIRAMAIPGSRHRIADSQADHAARYGRALMFLLGGDAFMEPSGIWIAGGAAAEFALVSDDGRPVDLIVRTPPVANDVRFDADGWHQQVVLRAGGSTIVTAATPRFRVSVKRGARPADFEPGSADVRFLGVWIAPR